MEHLTIAGMLTQVTPWYLYFNVFFWFDHQSTVGFLSYACNGKTVANRCMLLVEPSEHVWTVELFAKTLFLIVYKSIVNPYI